jgi:hypothetical protein
MTETIAYTTGTYYGEADPMHIWTITDEQGLASEMYVRQADLVIANVETREDRRGEGLARSLYEAAPAQIDGIVHDLPAHRTPEGDAFAQAVGGDDATECTIDHCVCSIDAA